MVKCCQNKLILFLILLIFTACSTHKRDVIIENLPTAKVTVKEEQPLSDQIKKHKKNKDFNAIIGLYEKNQQEIKNSVDLSYVMEAYYLEKRSDDAIKIGEKIFTDFPNLDDNRLNIILGVSYYQKGLIEAARRNLLKAKDSGNKNPLISYYFIDMYLKKGQNALALTEAANLEGEAKDYLQGIIYYKEGSYNKALEKFNSLSKFNKSVLFRAFCMYKLNKYDELITEWEKGEMRNFSEIYPVIADIYLKKGEVLKAKDTLLEAAKIDNKDYIQKNIEIIDEMFMLGKK